MLFYCSTHKRISSTKVLLNLPPNNYETHVRPDSHLDGKVESGKAEANRNSQ